MRVSTLALCGSLVLAFTGAACFQRGNGGDSGIGGHGGGTKGDPPASTGAGGDSAGVFGDDVAVQTPASDQTCGDGTASQVARVPDNGRRMDSAQYALRLLRRIAKDPNATTQVRPVGANIRVGDFVNYYALQLPETTLPSVDFRLEEGNANVGTLIARLPAPAAPANFQPRVIVAVDTSVSMMPLLGVEDALALELQAAAKQYGGEASLRTWTSPTYTSGGKNAVDNVNSAIEVARSVCESPLDEVTHLVLIGDGRASFAGLEEVLATCDKLRVDAIVVAHADEAGAIAADGAPIADVSESYSASALDPVGRLGGATLLVTDEMATTGAGFADVHAIGVRFPALFGDAYLSPRVILGFPGVLDPLSVSVAVAASSGLQTEPLAVRSVGYDDVITFRQLVQVNGSLDGACAVATLSAQMWFQPLDGGFQSKDAPATTLLAGSESSLRDYDDAVSKFAQTLRTGGSPDSAFSALSLAWSSLGCDAQGQLGCAQVGEMKTLLAPYKKIP